jgi:succinate dehydrogenase flavin-adding protein (antitoxin of CptAB toxin-antitoxin module)
MKYTQTNVVGKDPCRSRMFSLTRAARVCRQPGLRGIQLHQRTFAIIPGPNTAPEAAFDNTFAPLKVKLNSSPRPENESVEARRKRLLYQSKKRGWKETDLILGTWAIDNIRKLSEQELDQYEILLDQVDADVFAWVSEQAPTPVELDNELMQKMKTYVKSKVFDNPNNY